MTYFIVYTISIIIIIISRLTKKKDLVDRKHIESFLNIVGPGYGACGNLFL